MRAYFLITANCVARHRHSLARHPHFPLRLFVRNGAQVDGWSELLEAGYWLM